MTQFQDFSKNYLNTKIYDMHNPNTGYVFQVQEHLHHEKTPFQTIDIIQNDFFGKMMFIDGVVMLTEKDEFIYHEMITHVPVFSHGSVQNALVLGAGDGGVLRELAKHKNLNATLVEIDQRIVEVSKIFFPTIAQGFEASKAKVILTDSVKYLTDCKDSFDLILTDSTDPYGPAKKLFEVDFYKTASQKLNKNGIFVAQTESAFYYPESLKKIYAHLREAFSFVSTYWTCIPTYPSGGWTFCICSNQAINFENPKIEGKNILSQLKHYNLALHKACFALPNHIQKIVEPQQ